MKGQYIFNITASTKWTSFFLFWTFSKRIQWIQRTGFFYKRKEKGRCACGRTLQDTLTAFPQELFGSRCQPTGVAKFWSCHGWGFSFAEFLAGIFPRRRGRQEAFSSLTASTQFPSPLVCYLSVGCLSSYPSPILDFLIACFCKSWILLLIWVCPSAWTQVWDKGEGVSVLKPQTNLLLWNESKSMASTPKFKLKTYIFTKNFTSFRLSSVDLALLILSPFSLI